MATRKFEGRHDTFIVECDCGEGLSVERVDRPMMSGVRVTCEACDDDAFVYDDGGIYKMTGGDDLSIRVKNEEE